MFDVLQCDKMCLDCSSNLILFSISQIPSPASYQNGASSQRRYSVTYSQQSFSQVQKNKAFSANLACTKKSKNTKWQLSALVINIKIFSSSQVANPDRIYFCRKEIEILTLSILRCSGIYKSKID
jgi:hypothetical protein